MVRLRPMQPEDKVQVRNWRNLPEVAKYMFTDQYISAEEHEEWFGRVLQDETKRYWIIVFDGKDVGLINLYNIDYVHSRCYWGFYLVSPDVRGRGVGSCAWYAVMRYVFHDMGLNKLCSEVLAVNEASIHLHRTFGFQEEGRLRQHVLKQGRPHDVIVFGMLRTEWEARRPAIERRLRDKGWLVEALP